MVKPIQPAELKVPPLRPDNAHFLVGGGSFTDDISLVEQAYAVFLRAPVAHAILRGVDVSAARAMPGVLGVFTGADLRADNIGAIPPAFRFPGRDGNPMFSADMPVLVTDRIRFVGEPIAVVVAESIDLANDAAERIEVEFDELEAMPSIGQALREETTEIWPGVTGNIALDWEDGDASASNEVFAAAHKVVSVSLKASRVAPSAMEPRSAIGHWNGSRYTLIAGSQGVAHLRKTFAESVFRIPLADIRVLTFDVGGSFGVKIQPYPEYAAVMYAARRVGRPVKWTATRLESFQSDTHGRDAQLEGQLAVDTEGRILGLRANAAFGMGAYTSSFACQFAAANPKNCLSSVYRIPNIYMRSRMVLTNAAPLGPYRGAGRPEALTLVERLIETAARAVGIDSVELRRRNFIPPSAMPYRSANGLVYDSGEFEAVMERAIEASEWHSFATRRQKSESAGLLRGIGMASFMEVAGAWLSEDADIRFTKDGDVELRLALQAIGQGHGATFPKLVANILGIDASRVSVLQGDSDNVLAGVPVPGALVTITLASRSAMMGGSAALVACTEAIRRGKQLAAELLEAPAQDILYGNGRFTIQGTDRSIGFAELSAADPSESSTAGEFQSMNNRSKFVSPSMTFPNGCHVCEVEIDPMTGSVQVVSYVAVDDVGTVLNEHVVNGQIQGGVAQGLGQLLGEEVVYANDGQLVNASFMDYYIPRADAIPFVQVIHHPVPCTTNPLGVKGAGESGVAGALPAGLNAILDALASAGVTNLDMPMTPQKVWLALQQAT